MLMNECSGHESLTVSSQDKKFNKSSGKATSSKKKKQVTISVEFK